MASPDNFSVEESALACPYFMPVARIEEGTWPHPGRLPLGCGWRGYCTAPGHEREDPSPEALVEFCNLGYAETCGRLPRERAWDAVRFAVSAEKQLEKRDFRSAAAVPNRVIYVEYVCELDHRPKDHGKLEFDGHTMAWVRRHSDDRVQKMAECFLETYLGKRKSQAANVPGGDQLLAVGSSETQS